MRFRASDVAAATGGVLRGPDVELDGASFDSRSVGAGQLFVPIVGERDGHDFIRDAVGAGARAFLTSRPPDPAGDPPLEAATAILVADPAQALLELAAWARGRVIGEVVGITGSVGKTSTKDLVAAAVGAERRVTANERSFNNEQGLPVTILGAPDDTEVLVLEMGMRGFGQIAELCRIGRPTVGVVTTVGEAHTELVGGIEGVARAKRELVEALPASGTAVLNADDHRVLAMADATAATVVTFGSSPAATVRIEGLELDELARPRFTVRTPWGSAAVRLAVSGRHMAANAAAALAVAGTVGVSIAAAADALSGAAFSAMRMDVRRTGSGAIVLDDTYNANPTSMRAALEALAGVEAGRRIAVLGEMAEIEDPEAGHREIAELTRALGIELVAARTARYGVEAVEDPVTALGSLGPDDAVLFKASRFVGLDRDVARLLAALA